MKTLSSFRIFPSTEYRAALLSLFVTALLSFLALQSWCTPSCFEIPAGLVFRLRADHHQEKINDTIRKDFQPFNVLGNKIEAGVYVDFIRAQKGKNTLRDKGFSNVELVAYFNHSEISINDAITLINNRNASEEEPTQSISVQQMDSLLALHAPADFHYSICIDMKDAATVNTFFNLKEKPETIITPAGKTLYLFGKFSSSEEATVFLELMIQQGLANIELTAWTSNKEQIPLERAQQLEGQQQAMARK
jgi:hypothetical protein